MSRMTVAASARSASCSAAGMPAGIWVNGAYNGLLASPLTYGSMVRSRPITDTRGTVYPRARPARMLTICSSKWRGTSRSRERTHDRRPRWRILDEA